MSMLKGRMVKQPISKLNLDPENPRLGIMQENEEQIISFMLNAEKEFGILKLMRAFANGLIVPSDMYAVKRKGKLIVIDGNRRITVLKLLNNYKLAPFEYQQTIKRYSSRAEVPRSVYIFLLESDEDSLSLLSTKHIGEKTKNWSYTVTSLHVYREWKKSGLNLASFSEHTNTKDLSAKIRYYLLYEWMCKQVKNPKLKPAIDNPYLFTYSIIQRLLPDLLSKYLGLRFEETRDDIVLIQCYSDQSSKERVELFVEWLDSGKITTRTIDALKKEKMRKSSNKDIIEQLNDKVQVPEEIEPVTVEVPDEPRIIPNDFTPSKEQKKSLKHRKSETSGKSHGKIIGKDFSIKITKSTKLINLIEQLQRLPLSRYSTIGSVVLRSLCEFAIKYFIMYKIEGTCKEFKADINSVRSFLSNSNLPEKNSYLNQLEIVERKVGELNGFVHDPHVVISRDEVTVFWNSICNLMGYLLNEDKW